MMRFRVRVPRRGLSLAPLGGIVLWLSMLSFVLLLVMAMDETSDAKAAARLGEAKRNLHDIQVSVEQYLIDNEEYPAYLIGGGRDYTAKVDVNAARPFGGILVLTDLTRVPDPLVRLGYLSYPRNPFTAPEGRGDTHWRTDVHQMQLAIAGSDEQDPLRNGEGGLGSTCGTRFGQFCQTVGQVLADPRYPQIVFSQLEQTPTEPYPSYAGVGYPFWDLYTGDQPKPYLPGEFFYKSSGVTLSADAATSEIKPILPDKPRTYIMGLYGPRTDKGKDVIGEEQQVIGWVKGADGQLSWDAAAVKCWPWTRSTADPQRREGCPYLPGQPGEAHQYQYGNPNGVRDGLALVLTSGAPEEYEGSKKSAEIESN